jgi:cyanate lyase
MKREQLTEKILDIKREKGWSWKHISEEIGGMSPILVVGALLGQMKLPKALAEKAGNLFGLADVETRMLSEVPARGAPMPPTDPLLYRFYELVMVNGPALKALIEEGFGDGIMSAIDFDLTLDRLPDAKGDRVRLVMSGKFLGRAGVWIQGGVIAPRRCAGQGQNPISSAARDARRKLVLARRSTPPATPAVVRRVRRLPPNSVNSSCLSEEAQRPSD